jgi:hypothetical protein
VQENIVKRRMFVNIGAVAKCVERLPERKASGADDFGFVIDDGESGVAKEKSGAESKEN